MRPRRELALGLGAFFLVAVVIVVRALTEPTGGLDARLSTFRAEPSGAMAWADALGRLRHRVVRWRRPLTALPLPGKPGELLAILGPDLPLATGEIQALDRWSRKGGDLLLVGPGNWRAMECAGWRFDTLGTNGVTGTGMVGEQSIRISRVRSRLVPAPERPKPDSTRAQDVGIFFCPRREVTGVDTLLRAPSGAVLALRATYLKGGSVTLVADPKLFTNRAMRESDAGEFALSVVGPEAREIVVDEYHHAYGARGSLTDAILEWSARAPWGWVLWQCVAVGLIALLLTIPRTGPVRPLARPSRRSPLEHVGALARTLAATKGHDVAVLALVRGLRRRLSADGRPAREDPRAWLHGLQGRVRTEEARHAVAKLLELTTPGRDAVEVLAAAHAVEDVWQELRPRPP